MEMFLMVATVSLLGMVVSVGLFAAATRENSSESEMPVRVEQPLPAAPPRFFLAERAPAAPLRVPIEVLLLQIERHVRLEQAAAESFLDAPTIQSLHSRTTSPLMH
jgi:hypothetical protein